jgi:hypothetical protein
MRTTITVADDVFAEMERLRTVDGLGPSEALNLLARRGMTQGERPRADYVHRALDIGIELDVNNVADVLDLLDHA